MKSSKKLTHETGHAAHIDYNCIDAYKPVAGEWLECPNCKLKPMAWEFDNGRQTACGCWTNKYNQHHVYAESIMSVHIRTDGKQMNLYDSDGLRKNWNHWCETGEHLFGEVIER